MATDDLRLTPKRCLPYEANTERDIAIRAHLLLEEPELLSAYHLRGLAALHQLGGPNDDTSPARTVTLIREVPSLGISLPRVGRDIPF